MATPVTLQPGSRAAHTDIARPSRYAGAIIDRVRNALPAVGDAVERRRQAHRSHVTLTRLTDTHLAELGLTRLDHGTGTSPILRNRAL